MALIPNRVIYSHFPTPIETQDEWSEAMGNTVIMRGYHQNPAKENDEILIESTTSVQNKWGHELHVVDERWSIDRHGAPPTMYTRTTSSNQYLPGLGQRLREVQTEETQYWTFTPLAGNNVQNLAKTRRIGAYVVYDQPEDPTKPTDAETEENLNEVGVDPGPVRDRLFSTGRLWSDATAKGVVVPEEGHNQFTIWMDDVITVIDRVDEEWDRWILVTITKNALRPGDVKVSEPREIKKQGISYSLPVPLDPPELACLQGNTAITCTITKGGAFLPGGWLNDAIHISPQQYKLYRATVSEPARTSTPDWPDWYEDGEEPEERNRKVIENTAVTDFAGGTISPLPPAGSHTEPHDPDEPEPEYDTYFQLIATLDNEQDVGLAHIGRAVFVDEDVVPGAVYEYYATCTYGSEESEHSNHVEVDYNGSENRTYRLSVSAGEEVNGAPVAHVDILAPDDPSMADDDYGSVYEFEIPTSDPPEDIAAEIAERQFQDRHTPDVIAFDVLTPLLGLEYAMAVGLPNVDWTTYSDDMILTSQTIANDYVLVGYHRNLERKADGTWASPTTTLRLQEYPR